MSWRNCRARRSKAWLCALRGLFPTTSKSCTTWTLKHGRQPNNWDWPLSAPSCLTAIPVFSRRWHTSFITMLQRKVRSRPMKHVVVLGGGITGLAAAYTLTQAGRDALHVTIVEADKRIGGKIRTRSFAGVPVDL